MNRGPADYESAEEGIRGGRVCADVAIFRDFAILRNHAATSRFSRPSTIRPPTSAAFRSGSCLIPAGESPNIRVMSSEVSHSYRYIVRSPDVRGGHARVEGTRTAVHDVIGLLQNGETVDSITGTCLPAITKAQVYECLAYYEGHRGEIDLLVARQMADAHDQ